MAAKTKAGSHWVPEGAKSWHACHMDSALLFDLIEALEGQAHELVHYWTKDQRDDALRVAERIHETIGRTIVALDGAIPR